MRKVLQRAVALAVVGVAGYVALARHGASALTTTAADAIAAVPTWIPVALVASVALAVLGRVLRSRGGGATDPVRMYPGPMRAEVFARAGGQCEYTGWAWQRCRAAAEHADHIIPWSKGGATSLQNGAASCAHHNTSKGAKLLTRRQVRSLERRRRRYFPVDADVHAGQRYGEPSVAAAVRTAPPAVPAAAPAEPPVAGPAVRPTAPGRRAWESERPVW